MRPFLPAPLVSRARALHKLIRQVGAFPRKDMDNITHEERTAAEPREAGLHKVYVNKVEQVSRRVRIIELGARSREEALKVSFLQPLYVTLTNFQYLQYSSSQANG